jgi:hypothetical protein
LKRVGLQYADYRKKPLPPPGSAANKITEADRAEIMARANDSSGRSPAWWHHRESLEARAGNGGGLFHFLKSDGGAACEHATLSTRALRRRTPVAVRAFMISHRLGRHARTCRQAAR